MTDLQGPIVGEPAIANFKLLRRSAEAPDRLTRLVRRFSLHQREAEIRRCFNLVCGSALRSAACRSSLNADGTPVQFALSLAKGRTPAFEFVGESFRAGMEYPARRALGLELMARLAPVIGAELELHAVRRHLEALADGCPAGDYEDPAGAFWIGASFDPAGETSMTVYANARRGNDRARWKRLAEFTRSVAEADWPRIFAVAEAAALKPLGAGVRVSARRRPHVRVYFGTYGVRPEDYRRMFREAGAGEAFDGALALFFEETLGEAVAFPTRSAVFSFGSTGDGGWSPKLELCGHCAWRSDCHAETRCGRWLDRLAIDTDLYRDTVGILAGGREQQGAPHVHAFVGVGMRHEKPYASIYLNPGRGGL
jgi:hypothetical protein